MANRLNATSLYTFSDAAGASLRYTLDFESAYDDAYVKTHIEVNGPEVRGRTGSGVAIDTAAAGEYGTLVDSVDSLLNSGGERQGLAEYRRFLYANPAERLPSLRLTPASNPAAMWPVCLALEVSDPITVIRFADSADPKTLELFVEGIKVSGAHGGPVVFEIATSPRDTRTFLQVGHATRGKVGPTAGNRIPGIGQLP